MKVLFEICQNLGIGSFNPSDTYMIDSWDIYSLLLFVYIFILLIYFYIVNGGCTFKTWNVHFQQTRAILERLMSDVGLR